MAPRYFVGGFPSQLTQATKEALHFCWRWLDKEGAHSTASYGPRSPATCGRFIQITRAAPPLDQWGEEQQEDGGEEAEGGGERKRRKQMEEVETEEGAGEEERGRAENITRQRQHE